MSKIGSRNGLLSFLETAVTTVTKLVILRTTTKFILALRRRARESTLRWWCRWQRLPPLLLLTWSIGTCSVVTQPIESHTASTRLSLSLFTIDVEVLMVLRCQSAAMVIKVAH